MSGGRGPERPSDGDRRQGDPRTVRLYRAALHLLPADFRARNGVDMVELFREALDDVDGPVDGARTVMAALTDVARTSVRLRTARSARALLPGAVAHEARLAARSLRRSPGFTALALTTLALGIGAVTAVYSVLSAVVLEPLPYPGGERIGILWHDLGDGAQSLPALHLLDARDYEAWSRSFHEVTWATGGEGTLRGEGGPPVLVDQARVAADFLDFFGAEPVLGRGLQPDETVPGGPGVAVLAHRLWVDRYGADPGLVGRTIDLNGQRVRVVGVLPPDFRLRLPPTAFLLRDADVYLPLQVEEADLPPRNYTGYTAFVRLHEGVGWEAAQAELDAMAARLRETHPAHATADTRARVVPLDYDVTHEVRPGLWAAFGAVGLVLLIACTNVANLMLARGRGREKELAVRTALGASRWTLAREVLLESGLITAAGAVLGVGVAQGVLQALSLVDPGRFPRLDQVAIDLPVLGFTLLMATGSTLLAGLVPALLAGRADVAPALSEGGRSGSSRRRRSLQRTLVVVESALSVVLLVGAGLMMRSFVALETSDPGFDATDRMTFRLRVGGTAGERIALIDQLRERLEALPGAGSVGVTTQLPLTGSGPLQPYAYDEETARAWESVSADERGAWPGFFEAMGVTVLEGRGFDRGDNAQGARVIVIDERLAKQAFPDGAAVGSRLQLEPEGAEDDFAEIVGVVEHVHLNRLEGEGLPQIWFPYLQSPWTRVAFAVEATGGDAAALAPGIRRVVEGLDPDLAVDELRTLESLVGDALARTRLILALMAGFALLALGLAAVGLYGVVTHGVRSRTREFGIRLALGERPGHLHRTTLIEELRPVLLSLAIGLPAAVLLSGSLSSMLYGVEPLDPWTYLVVAVVLTGVAAVACWVPARRATRVDPREALNAE